MYTVSLERCLPPPERLWYCSTGTLPCLHMWSQRKTQNSNSRTKKRSSRIEVKAEKVKPMDKDHKEGDESKETILEQKQLEKMQEKNFKSLEVDEIVSIKKAERKS